MTSSNNTLSEKINHYTVRLMLGGWMCLGNSSCNSFSYNENSSNEMAFCYYDHNAITIPLPPTQKMRTIAVQRYWWTWGSSVVVAVEKKKWKRKKESKQEKKLDLFNLKVLSVKLIKDIFRRHLDYRNMAMISHYDIYSLPRSFVIGSPIQNCYFTRQ